jgi:CBS domain-containing membrane protein
MRRSRPGIGMTGALCSLAFGSDPRLPMLIAPVGASAVLLFAVPASPLAQPWPIIGGNVLSAIIGTVVGMLIQNQVLAAGVAVALAIAAMSVARCLHPPGGAAALTAVLAGPSVAAAGYLFPIVPIGGNSIVLVALGWVFHRFPRHSYPHVSTPVVAADRSAPSQLRAGFLPEDIDAALVDRI